MHAKRMNFHLPMFKKRRAAMLDASGNEPERAFLPAEKNRNFGPGINDESVPLTTEHHVQRLRCRVQPESTIIQK